MSNRPDKVRRPLILAASGAQIRSRPAYASGAEPGPVAVWKRRAFFTAAFNKILEALFACLIVLGLVSCGPKSASMRPSPSDPVSGQAVPKIGLLWWPAEQATFLNPLADDIEACLADMLTDKCPELGLMYQQQVRDSLFPLMEPGTQPASEEAFAAMLTRRDVRDRLAGKGLRYLVTFTGGTQSDHGGFILCGAGYGGAGCLGFAWIDKDTRIDAVIWELYRQEQGAHLEDSARGTTLIPAFLLPIPIPAPTVSKACEGLGRRIVAYIRLHSGGTECRPGR